jgi:hypothetical protein
MTLTIVIKQPRFDEIALGKKRISGCQAILDLSSF